MEIIQEHFIALFMMGVLLVCSGFFSGMETALFSLKKTQIARLRKKGAYFEKLLTLMVDNPSALLISILFGNIIVNILFFSTSAVVAQDLGRQFGDLWEAVVGIVVLLLVIIFGEILPKAAGISFAERIVRMNAFILCSWVYILTPVRYLLEFVTRKMEPKSLDDMGLSSDDLKMLIESTQQDSSFGKQEKAIVEDIVNLSEMNVRELMVPRVHQLFREVGAPLEEALHEAVEKKMELIPVYEGEEDNLVGVVEVRDLFINHSKERTLRPFVKPIRFVPETKKADEMLREFLAADMHLVGVVDEYGGLAGTIVMEDLLEEVVGEFNAMEDLDLVERLGDSTYRLSGRLGIREWRGLFVGFVPDELLRTLALDTLSGLVVSLLKHLPKEGDVVCVKNLQFTVERVRANRIESVLLDLATPQPGGSK